MMCLQNACEACFCVPDGLLSFVAHTSLWCFGLLLRGHALRVMSCVACHVMRCLFVCVRVLVLNIVMTMFNTKLKLHKQIYDLFMRFNTVLITPFRGLLIPTYACIGYTSTGVWGGALSPPPHTPPGGSVYDDA